MGLFDAFRATPEPAKRSEQRPITASGKRLDLTKELDRNQLRQNVYEEWQREAWAYFDAIGEIKYGFGMLAAVMSRIRLFAGVDLDPDSAPLSVNAYVKRQHDQTAEEQEDDQARLLQLPPYITEKHLKYSEKLIKELLDGPGGASGFMRNFTLNMSVAGECYLVQYDDAWHIKSTHEIIVQVDGSIYLREQRASTQASTTSGVSGLDKLLPKDTYVARMWRPHPRYSNEPESSMLGIREPCDELITLQRMIRTVARSRMNAGILYIPEGLSVAGSTLDEDVATEEELHDELIQDLYDTFTDPIEDEASPASVVPSIISGPADMAKAITHITVSRETDQWLVERSDRALERILQGIDMPKDVVSGMANVKYCVDDQTEALTRHGWKSYDQLSAGDEVWTISPTTKLGEWQKISAVNTFDVIDERMHSIETRDHSSLTTGGHRWMTTDGQFYTNDEIDSASDSLYIKIPLSAAAAELPDVPTVADDMVELLAWLYTEGSFKRSRKLLSTGRLSNRRASIAQSRAANPTHHERIRQLLTRMYGPESEALSASDAARVDLQTVPRWRQVGDDEFHLNEPIVATFSEYFEEDQSKTLKRDVIYAMTRVQLELFLQVSSWGDGCGERVSGSVFGQKYESRQEIFELACHLLGYAVNRRANHTKIIDEDGRNVGWYDTRVKQRNFCGLPRSTSARDDRPVKSYVEYTGTVWCPTTPNGTWFARRDGKTYFTGNSNALQIDASLFKSHIEPLALMLCDTLNTIFFTPAMEAAFPELRGKDLSMLCIWYDPSEVVTSVDPAAAAKDGYDNFTISADAWRRAHGFSDGDAPGEEELARRFMLNKGTPGPEQLAVLFSHIFPEIVKKGRQSTLENSPVPMPTSAQELLFGRVVSDRSGSGQSTEDYAEAATPDVENF